MSKSNQKASIKQILESVSRYGTLAEQEQKAHGTEPKDVTTDGDWDDTEQDKRPLDKKVGKEAIDTSKGENAPNETPDHDDEADKKNVFKGKGINEEHEDKKEKPSIDVEKIKDAADDSEVDVKAMKKLLDDSSDDKEFVKEALEIFQATINASVDAKAEAMANYASSLVAEAIEHEITIMEAQIEDYLNVAILEWADDNRLAVETNIRATIAESFMQDLTELFESYNVKLPEESVDLYEQAIVVGDAVIEENEALAQEVATLKEEMNTVKKELTIAALIEETDMPLSEAERIRNIAKQIEFTSVTDFESKLNTIAESYNRSSRSTLSEGSSRRKFTTRGTSTSVDSDGMNAITESNEYVDPDVAAIAARYRA